VLKKASWLLLMCFPITSLAGAGLGVDHGFQTDSMEMVESHDSGCPHTKAATAKHSAQYQAPGDTDAPDLDTKTHGSSMCNQCVMCGTLLIDAEPVVALVAYSLPTYPSSVQAWKPSVSSLIEHPPRI